MIMMMLAKCVKLLLLVHAVDVLAYNYGSRPSSKSSEIEPSYHKNSYNHRLSYKDTVKLRHSGHSKFSRLDGVLGKLNRYKTTTTTTQKPRHMYRFMKGRKYDTFDNYDDYYIYGYKSDDFESEAEKAKNNEYEDNEYADDDDDDDEMEEEDEEKEENTDMQAEEATASSTSSLTQYKWNNFGTKAKVEETRRNFMQTNQQSPGEDAAWSAIEHMRRVSVLGKCSAPKAKVVNIQQEHPTPGKKYLPQCTVLFRCGEDTGCCSAPNTTCQPKKQTLVHLYFYTTLLGYTGNRIEKLSFQNHTECSCMKNGEKPEDIIPPENLRAPRAGLLTRSAVSHYSENSRSCNCPEVFVGKLRYDSKCVCDCAPTDMDCINMKRGKEHFSLKDRMCMIDGKCGTPICEYGVYMKSKGRCPRKQEKLDAYASVTTTRNLN